MRIVAGAWRGRTLTAPPGQGTRPTADRVRQALFDMLMHAEWGGRAAIEGAVVLDVFAGTGALGLEALSRGAASACFIESDPAALKSLRANVAACRAEERTDVVAGDALGLPGLASIPVVAPVAPVPRPGLGRPATTSDMTGSKVVGGRAKPGRGTRGAVLADTTGASFAATKGAIRAEAEGASLSGTKGVIPAETKRAWLAGTKGGSLFGTTATSLAGTGGASLVFLDPPYAQNLVPRAIAHLRQNGTIALGALIIAETGRDETWLPDEPLLAERHYGAARILVFRSA